MDDVRDRDTFDPQALKPEPKPRVTKKK